MGFCGINWASPSTASAHPSRTAQRFMRLFLPGRSLRVNLFQGLENRAGCFSKAWKTARVTGA